MPASLSLLLFLCGTDRLALPLSAVREVVPLLPVARPPTLPRPLVGFIALRGETLPLLSPRLLFAPDLPSGPLDLAHHILVPHGAGAERPALLVDRVDDVVTVDPDDLRTVDADASQNGAIAAEAVVAGGVAHLLSLDRLLDEAERQRIATLTRAAERRAAEWVA